MKTSLFTHSVPKFLVAGGSVALAIGLMTDLYGLPSFRFRKNVGEACQQVIRAEAKLSRDQLAKLLIIPEGQNQKAVRQVVQDPYCKLSSLQVRVGATAQREAYPLDFDANTWLVVLYEGEQYVGYRFNTR